MSRILMSLAAVLLAVFPAMGQKSLDFASKFIEECDADTAIQCVTVSPQMMEQLAQQGSRHGNMSHLLSKLKSARIVTATVNGEDYYRRAENLLKGNPQRFRFTEEFEGDGEHGVFYIRSATNGNPIELVMLKSEHATGKFFVINLTGDLDSDFMKSVSETFGGKRDEKR